MKYLINWQKLRGNRNSFHSISDLTGYTEGLSVKLVSKQLLLSEAKSSHAIIETLIRKGILKTVSSEVTRLTRSDKFQGTSPSAE